MPSVHPARRMEPSGRTVRALKSSDASVPAWTEWIGKSTFLVRHSATYVHSVDYSQEMVARPS